MDAERERQGGELEPRDRELGERLSASRLVPAPGFRGALGRRLAAADPGYGPRPEWLRVRSLSYAGGGFALIALGWLLATGAL
jgi:hypothetical protein